MTFCIYSLCFEKNDAQFNRMARNGLYTRSVGVYFLAVLIYGF